MLWITESWLQRANIGADPVLPRISKSCGKRHRTAPSGKYILQRRGNKCLLCFQRILKLSDHYKSRIQGAFVCAFLESILSKMPIFLAFVVLSGFAKTTITGQTCLYVGLGLAAIVLVQMLVHYLSDSLQSAAGYLMFADKRIELGDHLRKTSRWDISLPAYWQDQSCPQYRHGVH